VERLRKLLNPAISLMQYGGNHLEIGSMCLREKKSFVKRQYFGLENGSGNARAASSNSMARKIGINAGAMTLWALKHIDIYYFFDIVRLPSPTAPAPKALRAEVVLMDPDTLRHALFGNATTRLKPPDDRLRPRNKDSALLPGGTGPDSWLPSLDWPWRNRRLA
jgi:hypothetical protein